MSLPAVILESFTAALRQALPRVAAPHLAAPHLPGASAALTALSLGRLHPDSVVVAVTAGPQELDALHADLLAFGHGAGRDPILFPAREEANEGDDAELAGARLAAIRTLAGSFGSVQRTAPLPVLIATSIHALQEPAPDPEAIAQTSTLLRVGEEFVFDDLVTRLVQGGYTRVPEVTAKGEMAVRGGLMDLWPATMPMPLRAEFFGAVLESLRVFDPATQTSISRRQEAWIPPGQAGSLRQSFLVDHLPPGAIILWFDHDRLRQMAGTGATEGPIASASAPARLTWDELASRLAARQPRLVLSCGDPPPAATPALLLEIAPLPGLADLEGSAAPDALAATRKRMLADLQRQAAEGAQVVLGMDTAGACEQLTAQLGPATTVQVVHAPLSGGFVLPAARLVLASQADLYAMRQQAGRRRLPSATAAQGGRIERLSELEIGDLVVHLDHGIGRYLGATEIEMDGRRTEVLTLEYAEGARLHVPVAHVHLLSRYIGVGGTTAPLHRLGGKRWTREKADAERSIRDLAASLLETQARRQVRPGFAFQTEPAWMHPFEASFPYRETIDQEQVIADVKADLAAARPMDRLVCGDAGYGKTEIAMRAAFIAVMNGKQVAVLVPTTVLAEQHAVSFRERLAAEPVRIEVVSRFRTAQQRQRTLDGLADGTVDIVIGTHALLQPGVVFKDLGLLIVDEEQRFGVAHKEALKQVRAVVDVLTLTATPIPRTLYLSLTGARDMSLLQTPPQERLAVETRIVRDSDPIIRSAILQELNREGQVYFLYNRVLTIDLMRVRLERLVPEARIAVAHGQMSSGQLSAIMRDFAAGACDVLLCTTIVESGLDIPRANTILVHRADRFGLADLYQLRGRVGRSSHKAFAYFLLPEHGQTDEEGRQRLAALKRHSGLGAGFNIAMRDLEIRGAGNLLGAAQSGHIAAIGFGLYCQLLRRTVARLQGKKLPLLVDVVLQLDFIDMAPGAPDAEATACLPYAYIEDEPQRIAWHRRLAEAVDLGEVRKLRAELTDRYGRPPPPATRLLRLTELRIAAATRGLARIETREGRVWLLKRNSRDPHLVRNRLPVLNGRSADQKIATLFKLVSECA